MRIYLAGGMSDISFDESNTWRKIVKNRLRSCADVVNPNDYYNKETIGDSQKEIRDFDLYKLKSSDIIIVNFNYPESIGTAQELAIAKEYEIPVIGLNKDHKEIHPWLLECTNKMFDNLDRLLEYVIHYYLS